MTRSTTISVGRTVLYTLTELDRVHIHEIRHGSIFTGNRVAEGDVFPLVVTKVWPDGKINGQVLLDGNHNHWVTSAEEVNETDLPYGRWFWPPLV